jgi:hypothetical protein
MTNKICACCGQLFEPRPQVPNQAYCPLPACWRARRQRWQRNKMQTDPDYRDNQIRSQRTWLGRHPEYWRNYRETNPEYVERNKSRQRSKHNQQQEVDLAKMDVSQLMALRPGLYRIAVASGLFLGAVRLAADIAPDGRRTNLCRLRRHVHRRGAGLAVLR